MVLINDGIIFYQSIDKKYLFSEDALGKNNFIYIDDEFSVSINNVTFYGCETNNNQELLDAVSKYKLISYKKVSSKDDTQIANQIYSILKKIKENKEKKNTEETSNEYLNYIKDNLVDFRLNRKHYELLYKSFLVPSATKKLKFKKDRSE